jgi:hypothetical protein
MIRRPLVSCPGVRLLSARLPPKQAAVPRLLYTAPVADQGMYARAVVVKMMHR